MKSKSLIAKGILVGIVFPLIVGCQQESEDIQPLPDPIEEPNTKTPIYLPDAAFEAHLISIGVDSDKEINQQIWLEDALESTYLFIFGDELEIKITDLTGIEAFKNLEQLSISDTKISSIDLSTLEHLETLSLTNSQLVEVDLSNNKKLTYLDLKQNDIEDLNLSANSELKRLMLQGNALKEIDLSSNTILEEIRLTGNLLEHIVGLEQTKNLEILDLGYNELTFLKVGLPHLKWLFLTQNRLSDIDLKGSTSLEFLYTTANHLSSLDLSDNKELIYVETSGNQLEQIDLSVNTKLEVLHASVNQLERLDVSMLRLLKDLRILSNDKLTCVTIADGQYIETVIKRDDQKLSAGGCS
jgi:uncharacterized protein YjbI with pentapeptide repeats